MSFMTLKDLNTGGPSWIGWAILVIFIIITILMLAGKGGKLIAGYNTSTPEEQAKYNEKKLCHVVGWGFLFIDILIFVMLMWEAIIPIKLAYVMFALFGADIVVMLVLMATICKKNKSVSS